MPSSATETNTEQAIAVCALTATDDAGRALVKEPLEKAGIRAVVVDDPARVVQSVVEQGAAFLVLDTQFHKFDAASFLRVLKRHPQTSTLPVLLLCPATVDREQLRAMMALGVVGVVLKPVSTEELSTKAAAALARAPKRGDLPKASVFDTRVVPTNNSMLVRGVLCPFHPDVAPANFYMLRTGKIETEVNVFDITIYKSATKGADFIDYHLLNIIVCPRCGFASNNMQHFRHPGDDKVKSTAFVPAIASKVASGAERRAAIAADASPAMQSEARTPRDAAIAHLLAIDSSISLGDADEGRFAIEWARAANYHLRLALMRDAYPNAGFPAAVRVDHHELARDLLKRAFAHLDGVNLYRTIYQLVAVGVHLNDDATAHTYAERLKEMSHDPSIKGDDAVAIQRYLARVAQTWSDRDMYRRKA